MSSFTKMKQGFGDQAKENHFIHCFDDYNYQEGVFNWDEHPQGRHYVIPDKNPPYGPYIPKMYPSATNVLGQIAERGGENAWLAAWKERVGEEEAARISHKALRRGTAMHDLAEQYLLNKPVQADYLYAWQLFKAIQPYLDKINNIMALEHPMVSDLLGVAGRVDCIGEYDESYFTGMPFSEFSGIPTLIDFKSSKRLKADEDIAGYKRQITLYAMAFQEMTGIRLEFGIILMGTDDIGDGKPGAQVFEVFLGDYRKTVIDELADLRDYLGVSFDKKACYNFFL